MNLTLEATSDIMNDRDLESSCEDDLAQLLRDLTQVQDDLLDVLTRKRQCMALGDQQAMAELQVVEEELCQRLQHCHDRRAGLLAAARQEGLVSGNLRDLAGLLSQRGAGDLRKEVKQASSRMGLLQHNCLANWVLAQKALLHASQMLEIIATGGRLQPTYSNRDNQTARGALVDQEA